MDASYNEMDVNMFNQYMYKSNNDSSNAPLSVQGQFSGQQAISNQYSGTMSDHTFHTPSFGDEEFDIPDVLQHHSSSQTQHHQLDQFQMHGMMNDQQASQAYGQHQWTQQATSAAEMTFQNHSDYHHLTNANENILMIQQSPQIQEPLMSATANNFAAEQPAVPPSSAATTVAIQSAPINSHENGSNSEDSDDNALNDPSNTFKSSVEAFNEDDNGKGGVRKASAGKVAVTAKGKQKKKRDPNEPLKPVSAYALFFRDTQAAIKGQNPNASFGEVSKIVASMWDVLAPEHKNVYKKKQETAKKEYLKALAAYRAENLQPSEETTSVSQNHPPASNAITPQPVQNFIPQIQTLAAPNFPQQNFVSQPLVNQTAIQQQSSMERFESNQHTLQQQPLQSITNNNNQMPPVATQPAHQNYEKCIRNGCLNPAIVSVDWEDEFCSNECCVQHCREVFSNFIQVNASNQQINFAVK